MNREHVATYLNDHLAGSVVIIDLLNHLAAARVGTETERFATQLRTDIESDRHELETLMKRLQIGESAPRKAAAWLAEKVTQIKLRLDDETHGALHMLEILDAVAVGIEGKRALWQALLAAATKDGIELQGTDYERLSARAEEQRSRVEPLRLKAAQEAFAIA